MPTTIHGTNGITFNDGSTQNTRPAVGFRNRIINGDMRIDQRNAGAAQLITAATSPYTVDRWSVQPHGSNVTGQRVAGSGGTRFNYQITGAAGNVSIYVYQRIEAMNCYDLAGQNVTLSCDLANSLTTSVYYSVSYANVSDNFTSTTGIGYGGYWTVNSTLTRYTAQIAIPAAATTGLQIVLGSFGQTSGTWTIGNVQLEQGSTATEFERRPIGTELALCQRYYEVIISQLCHNTAWATSYNQGFWKATKRASPTITLANNSGGSGATFSVLSTNSVYQSAANSGVGTIDVRGDAEL